MRPVIRPSRSTLYPTVSALAALGIAAVLFHWLRVAPAPGRVYPPGPEWYGGHLAEYDGYPAATALHLALGLLFAVAVPLQFSDSARRRWPALHRAVGRVVVAGSLVAAATGVLLGFRIPFGGRGESFAMSGLGGLFAFALLKGFFAARGRRFLEHRIWMTRAAFIGLSVATMRVLDTLLFPLHLVPDRRLFGLCFVLALALNLAVAESLLRPESAP